MKASGSEAISCGMPVEGYRRSWGLFAERRK